MVEGEIDEVRDQRGIAMRFMRVSSFKTRFKRTSKFKKNCYQGTEMRTRLGCWKVQSKSESMVELEEDRQLGRSAKISGGLSDL